MLPSQSVDDLLQHKFNLLDVEYHTTFSIKRRKQIIHEIRPFVRHCWQAARYNLLIELQYLHKHLHKMDEQTAIEASTHGHFDILQYAIKHKFPILPETALLAVLHGHLNCYSLLLQHLGKNSIFHPDGLYTRDTTQSHYLPIPQAALNIKDKVYQLFHST